MAPRTLPQARTLLTISGLILLLLAAFAPHARAQLGCADIGGVPSGDDCTLAAVFNCTGSETVEIAGDFTISTTGAIHCGGNDLLVNVGGDFQVGGRAADRQRFRRIERNGGDRRQQRRTGRRRFAGDRRRQRRRRNRRR